MYLRDQRSPLLDRLTFHKQSQQASEWVDKYYANLQILQQVPSWRLQRGGGTGV